MGDPMDFRPYNLKKKVDAGAEFIQTQAIYDIENFKRFMDYARPFEVKILAGIILLTSWRMAEFMNKNVPGVFVPQALIDEMKGAPKGEAVKTGIEIAARMIRQIKDESICGGVHIMAIGWDEIVPEIVKDVVGIGDEVPSIDVVDEARLCVHDVLQIRRNRGVGSLRPVGHPRE